MNCAPSLAALGAVAAATGAGCANGAPRPELLLPSTCIGECSTAQSAGCPSALDNSRLRTDGTKKDVAGAAATVAAAAIRDPAGRGELPPASGAAPAELLGKTTPSSAAKGDAVAGRRSGNSSGDGIRRALPAAARYCAAAGRNTARGTAGRPPDGAPWKSAAADVPCDDRGLGVPRIPGCSVSGVSGAAAAATGRTPPGVSRRDRGAGRGATTPSGASVPVGVLRPVSTGNGGELGLSVIHSGRRSGGTCVGRRAVDMTARSRDGGCARFALGRARASKASQCARFD